MKFLIKKRLPKIASNFSNLTLDEIREIESEIKSIEILEGDKRQGTARVGLELYGSELEGLMEYRISDEKIEFRIDGDDINAIEKFQINEVDKSQIELVHEVGLNLKSRLKKLLLKTFRGAMGRHMESELDSLASRLSTSRGL